MKMRLFATIGLALSLGLILTLAIAYAQGPTEEPREEEPSDDIGGLGLADPPPAGFSVQYMFTGVANDSTPPNNNRATSVHCTNFGTTAISVTIQLFRHDGSTASDFTDSLASNETTTYSTQDTFFTEFPLSSNVIEQGSGRILTKGHSQIICTAQLLQPGNTITPTFMAKLPMFDSAGNPSPGSGVGSVFLPVILK